MKRDWDLVRKIMFKIEVHPNGFAPQPFEMEGYDNDAVGYHVLIMGEAGLLIAHDDTGFDEMSPSGTPSRLTWEGHEFLDAARDDTRWNRAKTIAKKTGGLSFELLKQVLFKYASKAAMGLVASTTL